MLKKANKQWEEAQNMIDAVLRKFPKGCRSNGIDCDWTREWGCPGMHPGSKGEARDDGTPAFDCCCRRGKAMEIKREMEDGVPVFGTQLGSRLVTLPTKGSAYAVHDALRSGFRPVHFRSRRRRRNRKDSVHAVHDALRSGGTKDRILHKLMTKPSCLLFQFSWCY